MGIPTVSLIGNAFMCQADVVSRGLGLPLAYAEYPGAPMVDGPEELSTKVRNTLAPGVIKGLMEGRQGRDTPSTATADSEPAPGTVVMRGTLDEIQEYFYRRLWTDGMPIIPPTRERVDAFLRYTERDPHEALRVVPQEGREVTILSIAITGVMSGCRPEYLPLLIAVVEAMCDPDFHIEHCGSTPGWEPLVRVLIDAAMTGILIAGDPGRNQSRGYVGNHDQGVPTSRKIVLPKDWDALIAQQMQSR